MAVIDRSARTFQPTDLAGAGRREFISEARSGVARLRDSDGTSLSMVPTADLDHLSEARNVTLSYLALRNALTRTRDQRRVTVFGEFAWAASLVDPDLSELYSEVSDALARCISAGSFDEMHETLRAWRLTARLLARPDAAERLRTDDDTEDWDELARPESSSET